MLARCRVHEVSQEWGCEWGSSYMNESIHSVSSHDCRFLRSRMRCSSLLITLVLPAEKCTTRVSTSRGRRLRHSTSDALAVALAALHGQALREWRGAKTGKETTKSIIYLGGAGGRRAGVAGAGSGCLGVEGTE